MNDNVILISTGARAAVETAIDNSKGEKDTQWEEFVENESREISHW